ncbi:chemotaxis protein CheX [bacterium]|nr:chemotaxis protein CheX [bacterium]
MNADYINPFLAAAQNIFKTEIYLPLEIGTPLIKKNKRTTHEVSGIVYFGGDVTGCLAISLTESTAIKLASALIGERFEGLNSDCRDAIGEIVKMIADDAEKDFPNGKTTISVPEVVIGIQKVDYPEDLPMILIPCETIDGQFTIEIGIKET